MQKILVIQTAFIGDVILATSAIESLYSVYPEAQIDVLIRKGNESIFEGHPFVKTVYCWDKKKNKILNLLKLSLKIRSEKYDAVVNCHRHFSSGIPVLLSGAKVKSGFKTHPLAMFFSHPSAYEYKGLHETERYHLLIQSFINAPYCQPVLYPNPNDFDLVGKYKQKPYLCIAPASVWFTKQLPADIWVQLINGFPNKTIYLMGGSGDALLASEIIAQSKHPNCYNLCGQLSLLQSAALMRDALMNYTNDSSPMHLCTAVNAPTTAVFCNTIPAFGFGPLSTQSFIVETEEDLNCRPCGIHGYTKCPEGHFKCGHGIKVGQLSRTVT